MSALYTPYNKKVCVINDRCQLSILISTSSQPWIIRPHPLRNRHKRGSSLYICCISYTLQTHPNPLSHVYMWYNYHHISGSAVLVLAYSLLSIHNIRISVPVSTTRRCRTRNMITTRIIPFGCRHLTTPRAWSVSCRWFSGVCIHTFPTAVGDMVPACPGCHSHTLSPRLCCPFIGVRVFCIIHSADPPSGGYYVPLVGLWMYIETNNTHQRPFLFLQYDTNTQISSNDPLRAGPFLFLYNFLSE